MTKRLAVWSLIGVAVYAVGTLAAVVVGWFFPSTGGPSTGGPSTGGPWSFGALMVLTVAMGVFAQRYNQFAEGSGMAGRGAGGRLWPWWSYSAIAAGNFVMALVAWRYDALRYRVVAAVMLLAVPVLLWMARRSFVNRG